MRYVSAPFRPVTYGNVRYYVPDDAVPELCVLNSEFVVARKMWNIFLQAIVLEASWGQSVLLTSNISIRLFVV